MKSFCLPYDRISDRGGGIPHETLRHVFDYGYTTAGTSTDDRVDRGLFGQIVESRDTSHMHGYVMINRHEGSVNLYSYLFEGIGEEGGGGGHRLKVYFGAA